MRRILFYIITFLAGLVLQFGWMKYFAPFGLSPNGILVLTVLIGLVRGSFAGQIMGFAWGVAWDVLSIGLFGSNAFLLTCIGYLSGRLSRKWDETKIIPQIILVGILSLVYWGGMTVLYQVFAPSDFKLKVNYIIVLQPFYNMLIAPLVFQLGNRILSYINIDVEY